MTRMYRFPEVLRGKRANNVHGNTLERHVNDRKRHKWDFRFPHRGGFLAFRAGATAFINVTEYSRPIKTLEDATCLLPSVKVTCRDTMGEVQNRLTTLDWENQLLCHGVPWRLVVSVEETIAEEESVVLQCPPATWRACMRVWSVSCSL